MGVGVAGLGRVGRTHASNLARQCEAANLVAVFDVEARTTKQVAEDLGVQAVPTFDELLGHPGLEAVVVAAPTSAHAELAAAAAKAGKHVFCEKPVSLDRQETLRVVATLDNAGVKLQVGFHRRFDPATAAVAAGVKEAELGDIYLYRASQRDKAPPKPEFLAGSGGIFVDMGIHDFDLARWLVGDVASVSAHATALSSPAFRAVGDFDGAVAVLEFANGALGVVDISRVAGYGYDSSVELMGSKATARIDEPFLHSYELRADGTARRPLVERFDQRYRAAFVAEMEAFARTVLEDGNPLVTGLDALAAFDIAQAAQASCRLERPVKVTEVSGTGNTDRGGHR